MRGPSSELSVERLMQQWRTPGGAAPSYNRFMKVLRHLGLSDRALTDDDLARVETELLSRKWNRRDPIQ